MMNKNQQGGTVDANQKNSHRDLSGQNQNQKQGSQQAGSPRVGSDKAGQGGLDSRGPNTSKVHDEDEEETIGGKPSGSQKNR